MALTNRIRILAGNVHNTATLTATSEALPITNTQRSERALVWRSADLTPQVITGTLAAGSIVDCVALARHNLSAGGIRRIELLAGSDVVYDSGEIPTALLIPAGVWRAGVDPWGATYNDQLPVNTSLTVQWMDTKYLVTGYRITLSGSNEDGYMEVGQIFIGDTFQPEFNFSWNAETEWQESGEHLKTEGGSLRTVSLGDLRRQININLDLIIDSDRTQLISNLGKAGMGADLLVSLYPDSDSQMLELEGIMVCRRSNAIKTSHSLPGNWSSGLTFLEV